MIYRSILVACACLLLAAACTKRDESLVAPAAAPAPAAATAPAAAPAAEATAAAPAIASEPAKDNSWAGQVNQAKAAASAQGKAAQDQAAKADAIQK
jgi:hypothetical protein